MTCDNNVLFKWHSLSIDHYKLFVHSLERIGLTLAIQFINQLAVSAKLLILILLSAINCYLSLLVSSYPYRRIHPFLSHASVFTSIIHLSSHVKIKISERPVSSTSTSLHIYPAFRQIRCHPAPRGLLSRAPNDNNNLIIPSSAPKRDKAASEKSARTAIKRYLRSGYR